jgi:hypothetical protein
VRFADGACVPISSAVSGAGRQNRLPVVVEE